MSALWTAEEDAKLKQMLEKGSSYTLIGAALGRSRNAIAGYIGRHRAKLGVKPVQSMSVSASRKKAVRGGIANKARLKPLQASSSLPAELRPVRGAAEPEAVNLLPAVSGEIQPAYGIQLMNLGWRDCRYVIAGEGANALFCGDETVSPSCSWCAHHRALVFVPRVAVEKAREAVAA